MTAFHSGDTFSQVIENHKVINKIQKKLSNTNQELIIKIDNGLMFSLHNLIKEIRIQFLNLEKSSINYEAIFYKEILMENQQVIIRNQRLIATNEKFIHQEILFSTSQEIADKSRELFLKNQNITLNNFELIRKNHELIFTYSLPPRIFPEIPKKSIDKCNTTLERIVISSQLLLLSRITIQALSECSKLVSEQGRQALRHLVPRQSLGTR